ncbi:hypothetical protein GDO81_007155 [Engystomops pustulosus]|uniref:Uncharacterized protein n=1 Tax=Engystomops pustulosus TaxID=76066 RepID=A0AAV7C6V1_ENGPU|nr:hypothetical protein GDO81_007155 [Engystomops pustulosus]
MNLKCLFVLESAHIVSEEPECRSRAQCTVHDVNESKSQSRRVRADAMQLVVQCRHILLLLKLPLSSMGSHKVSKHSKVRIKSQ